MFAQIYRHVFKDTQREKALGGWYIKSTLFDESHFSNNCNL